MDMVPQHIFWPIFQDTPAYITYIQRYTASLSAGRVSARIFALVLPDEEMQKRFTSLAHWEPLYLTSESLYFPFSVC